VHQKIDEIRGAPERWSLRHGSADGGVFHLGPHNRVWYLAAMTIGRTLRAFPIITVAFGCATMAVKKDLVVDRA
jgi:hypothetical protein